VRESENAVFETRREKKALTLQIIEFREEEGGERTGGGEYHRGCGLRGGMSS